jgi:16S rRNA (cytosine1402-N4)-methyltransferase
MVHQAVMVKEVLRFLLHDESRQVVDATLGAAGHTRAILDARPDVHVVGVDRDGQVLARARAVLESYAGRVTVVRADYADIDDYLGQRKVNGLLVDLGVSSLQLDLPERGFSYLNEGPLDMRMSSDGETAKALIARSSERDLIDLLKRYGDLRAAERPRQIARAVHEASRRGEMESTLDLRKAVEKALGSGAIRAVLSQVFQAFRIAVNNELVNLERLLEAMTKHLEVNARIVILSYHSLEDRMVKEFFRRESTDCLCPPRVPVCACDHRASLELLTRRVVKPSAKEVKENPRSRSARLRAARFIGTSKKR